ncbi:uncharacterized protein [Nicotiana sylvestris]|uniref:Uncharacterized protein LOC104211835 isoform X1 n=1 Tax=Nicotiana sylvestris TaxID=4096 RepID=A0A1U7VBQ3_NICSY|nr:PREDICTED: uncharacterized protein LOC104211835 isoform X1 [Nicotiana sylvestris]
MVEKVDLVLNYGGRWVLKPQIVYIKKLTYVLQAYDVDLLSYIDICSEYVEKCGFKKVEQLLITGPSSRYFLVEGDSGIRTLQQLFSDKFSVLQFFAIDEGEEHVPAPSISHHNKPYSVTVDVGTDCESSEEEEAYELDSSDYDSNQLDLFSKERTKEVNDKLDNYKELKEGMSFKDLDEAKRIVGFYAIANKKGLKVFKSDTSRVSYKCDVGCPFRCLISKENKDQGFKIKILKTRHNCQPAYKNRRATPQALAHYFKNKVQNNPKYKVKDMRVDLEDQFNMNVNYSKMKRVKRLVLEKLEGSFIDDYNRLEAYAQELRDSNPGSDVVINISKDALAEGKRRFLRMYICFQALKTGWKAGLRPLIGLDGTFLKGK